MKYWVRLRVLYNNSDLFDGNTKAADNIYDVMFHLEDLLLLGVSDGTKVGIPSIWRNCCGLGYIYAGDVTCAAAMERRLGVVEKKSMRIYGPQKAIYYWNCYLILLIASPSISMIKKAQPNQKTLLHELQ